jgi:hypothetical protein
VNRRGEKFPSIEREREREKITAVGDSSWEFDSASYRTGEEKAFFVFQRGGGVGIIIRQTPVVPTSTQSDVALCHV